MTTEMREATFNQIRDGFEHIKEAMYYKPFTADEVRFVLACAEAFIVDVKARLAAGPFRLEDMK